MPATFPSHAAAVLPIKMARPSRFDGVALVVGSAAPDLGYPLIGFVDMPNTHTLAALLWWSLPVTLLLCPVVRRAAPVIAAHLPDAGPLALRDYGVLGRVRYPWYVTVYSALLGALTHVFWDGFTHNPEIGGWAVRRIPPLMADAYPGHPWWWVAQQLSTVVGGVAAIAMFVHIGRYRLVERWHGPAPVVPAEPARFWSLAAAGTLVYPLTWPVMPDPYAPHVQVVRLFWAIAAGLLAGALAASWRRLIPPRKPR